MRRRCPKCGAEWEINGPIGFREECPECAAFMHTCTNCRHYEPSTRGCRLPNTEAVHDRAGVNFCEEFEFDPEACGQADDGPAPEAKPVADDPRSRFEDLFRDSET